MANVNSHNLRMPPDSTGKRIKLSYYIEVPYTGMNSSFMLIPGDNVVIKRTGATVTSGFVIFTSDNGDGTGILGVQPFLQTQSPVTGVIVGDTIERQEAGVYVLRATASGVDVPYYVNTNQLVSYDNPSFGQKVDQYGAAFTRFTEGGVTFDGTGRMRQTNNITIMSQEFHDILPYHFSTTVSSTGTVTHDNVKMCAVLSTTGASGGYADVVSDKYMYHESNAALFITMAVRFGDSGKTNVTREWGLYQYSHMQGIFFRLTGTTLYAVMKNMASGSSVETAIPISDWSNDSIGRGTNNPSGFNIDLTKVNLFWIELVQSGAGIAKIGVYNEDNVRVLCHAFVGNNKFADGFLTAGSFPFHFHQIDNGGGSTSEMMVYSIAAELEGPSTLIVGTFYEGCSDPLTVNSMSSWVPLFSIRPRAFTDQITKTCTASTAGSNVITVSNVTSLTTGMQVQCENSLTIPSYTTITNITGNDLTLSKNVTLDIDTKLVNFGNSVNHNVILPKLVSVDVCDENDRTTPRRIKLEVFRDSTLTGAVWAKTKGNSQTDYKATLTDSLGAPSMSGGTAIGEWIVRGQADLDIGALFDYVNTYLVNKANGTDLHQLTIAAKTLDPGVSVNIVCALTWEEVESH